MKDIYVSIATFRRLNSSASFDEDLAVRVDKIGMEHIFVLSRRLNNLSF